MAVETRPELVGKRFLCVSGDEPLDLGDIGRWGWRAGVIRAVTHRDNNNSELTVYVEFDDLEWEKREWVKVYEDFQVFLLEQQLVWAKRRESSLLEQQLGTKDRHIQWPALTFRPLVGKATLGSITAVEFFSDRQLDFLSDRGAYQPYQDEVDSLSPVLRDNPELHEEVRFWLKDQKVQEIFLQGPYSLNGYRVRVYRQDSATQWFTGIITYHDLFSRNMVVMNDQVLEPQNVDPSMIQMTFLDDVVHSLLKGENIGIQSRRRSRSSNNQNNSAHGHYTRAQANSPRPVMNSGGAVKQGSGVTTQQQQGQSQRKGSDSSVPDDDVKGDHADYFFKSTSSKQVAVNKRRKAEEEEEKKSGLKRLRSETTVRSDFSESSDSEMSTKRTRTADSSSSSEQNSEEELKGKTGQEGHKSQGSKTGKESALTDSLSPWGEELQKTTFQQSSADREPRSSLRQQQALPLSSSQGSAPSEGQGEGIMENNSTMKDPSQTHLQSKDQYTSAGVVARTQTPSQYIIHITAEDANAHMASRENSEAVSALLASQNPSDLGSKMELVHSVVIRPVASVSESAAVVEREKQLYSSMLPCIKNASLADEARKSYKLSPSPDVPKPLPSPEALKHTPLCSPDIVKSKTQSVLETGSKPKPLTSPEVSKHKVRYPDNPSRSSFKPVLARGTESPGSCSKSPLIIDKNEHFTVYRDPALVRPNQESNHVSYLHPQLHPLHSSSHHHTSHLLPSSHHHLLSGVLSGLPPGPLLGGHPRLDSSGLGHLGLAHHHPVSQPQTHSHTSASYNQLGLYPIIWQYPNGTRSYPPGLNLPGSKWVHPENTVNSESNTRRNTASPWIHHQVPVSSSDSLDLLSHVPVRPANPHRLIKINPHASPPLPLAKTTGNLHKEDLKGFVDPIRTITLAHLKQEQDRSRTPTGKDSHLHHLYLEAHNKQQQQRMVQQQEAGQTDRASKYKEENRRILQESIEVAPFTAKIRFSETDREPNPYPRIPSLPHPYPRIPSLPSLPHRLHQEKETERPAVDLYQFKQQAASQHSLPPSNYFTTLSNSVVNEPPRLYPSKELNSYFEKVGTAQDSAAASSLSLGGGAAFSSKSLSKPPPLIKHQADGEGLLGKKISEQLNQQVSLSNMQSQTLAQLRSMPALHRAPVFHPPIQQTLDRKEAGYGRLSPPTLTPIQPVSSAGKVSERQKPPTLLPELREVSAVCKGGAAMTSSEVWRAGDSQSHDKLGWHSERIPGRKPGATTASVIVRPSTCIKYDGSPGAKTSSSAKDSLTGRMFPGSRPQTVCLKLAYERDRESGGKVILPNTNLEEAVCVQQYNNNFMRVSQSQGTFPVSVSAAANSVCNRTSDVTREAVTTTVSPSVSKAVTTSVSKAVTTSVSPSVSKAVTTSVSPSVSKAVTTTVSKAVTTTVSPSVSKAVTTTVSKAVTTTVSPSVSKAVTTTVSPSVSKAVTTSVSPSVSKAVTTTVSKAVTTSVSPSVSKAVTTTVSPSVSKAVTTTVSPSVSEMEMIKPCTVTLIASTSSDVEMKIEEVKGQEDKMAAEDRNTRRGSKRVYDRDSASESGEDSDASESSKQEQRAKRQPKPTYKKKQNDMQRRKGDGERDEEELKPNGIFRSAREKTKLKQSSNSKSNGIPRSVLKDWRKVKKLKQTGESFLQDDSCSEIGPNLQKCRECRVVRSKKGEQPAHSPVFCRFYYFRRLSYSKNGVIRVDGFSTPDQFDEEALSLWAPDVYEENELDPDSSKYILSYIGDQFCQMVTTENTAASWIKKDAKMAWKRAVRGVREMCDACEATLFNIHWVCHKCGFVVCLDCYKAKERKSSKDKELYAWLKCVKGQQHGHKYLMPTQIIPGTVLAEVVNAMHLFREKDSVRSPCVCTEKHTSLLNKLPVTNGVSQVLQNVLNHSNKVSLCNVKTEPGQLNPIQSKAETNGGSSPASDISSDSKRTPPESQSPLHFLADLAEQKSRDEKKENKESPLGKVGKEDKVSSLESLHCKASSLVSNITEQGSTLRDLLTTTAGKLRLGSTDAGIAFAPVYSTMGKSGRSMPNLLDDIIASVVENKIPASRGAKLSLKLEPQLEKTLLLHADIPHCWLYERRLLWLKDHRHPGNWKLFRECWRQGQPVLVTGLHKPLNAALWKADSFNQEFADHQGDLLNCKDGLVSNAGINEFWDGFEDLTKRPKSKDGDTVVYRLKDWPSGEEFMALMPSRYDDLMRNLPLPEYCDPEGNLNLASHLPSFFVRPDLGPRLCCAYGVAASQEQDFGTANLHMEVSDIVSVLVYVGVAKGNGVLSKTGVLKRLEEEDLDDSVKKRLKDSSETPGALWHIYISRDVEKIKEFLHKVAKEQGAEISAEHDPIREPGWYLSRKLRQRLWEEHDVQGLTVVQFLGDSVLIPAGALHQVQNLHSCVQVINDFVSPEHVFHSFHLTQELRSSREEPNYEDKLQYSHPLTIPHFVVLQPEFKIDYIQILCQNTP
uniref:Probable JmjC domain-containing histone demethylation protein 2C n=1 Tax=Salmo trutta TaxID=8032 RepID=A0A674C6J4_SALTR